MQLLTSARTIALGLFLAAIVAALDCLAQVPGASMRPTLIAVQVESLDDCIRWYTNILGFQLKARKEFPEHQLKLAILNLGDFELELVENPKTLKKSKLLSGGATDITGFAKVTFTVSDVGDLYQRLSKQGAKFAITLRDSNTKPGEQHFVVLDNENNWLQFAGRK